MVSTGYQIIADKVTENKPEQAIEIYSNQKRRKNPEF